MVNKRDPLQVSPIFRIKLIEIQKKIELKQNKSISIRELTDMIVSSRAIEDIEKRLLGLAIKGDIRLSFDGRRI